MNIHGRMEDINNSYPPHSLLNKSIIQKIINYETTGFDNDDK